MKNQIFQDMSPEERIQMLMDNSQKVTEGEYSRKMTEDERNIARKKVVDIDIELGDIDEELAEFKKDIKERRDPLASAKTKIIRNLRAGFVIETGRLFKIVDRDAKEVGFYNEAGELVEQRRMTKDDIQLTINEAFKQAANL